MKASKLRIATSWNSVLKICAQIIELVSISLAGIYIKNTWEFNLLKD